MEMQRSLSFKSRKLISFAVSSSFLFCLLFYYCVLKIAPLHTTKTYFHFASSFGKTYISDATNVSQETFDLTFSGKDEVLVNINGLGNDYLSGETLDLRNDEKELRENVSSLQVIESVKLGVIGNERISNLKKLPEVLQSSQHLNTSKKRAEINEKIRDSDVDKIERNVEGKCNIYDGKWVFDESYPLYDGKACPFIDEGFSCEANGRTDRDYMKWWWKPNFCDIPR